MIDQYYQSTGSINLSRIFYLTTAECSFSPRAHKTQRRSSERIVAIKYTSITSIYLKKEIPQGKLSGHSGIEAEIRAERAGTFLTI